MDLTWEVVAVPDSIENLPVKKVGNVRTTQTIAE